MHPIEPEELMAYLDGELLPQRASVAGHHLSHCLDCQLAAAELQDVSRRLLEWQIEELVPRVELVFY
jgi:anti-sigma factor RsiW